MMRVLDGSHGDVLPADQPQCGGQQSGQREYRRFKKSRVNFQDLMYQNLRMPAPPLPREDSCPPESRWAWGQGVAVEKSPPGDYTQTKNQLDMAIEGKGSSS